MILCSNLHHTLAFIEGVGGPELLMVMVIVLVLFGGKKLPEFARGLGKSLREIKKATSGVEEEFKRAMDDEPERPRTTKPQATIPTTSSSEADAGEAPGKKPESKPADEKPQA
tara:strand:+ start:388 stop:726 length:339 start_codon:yes stop_codon:yes gene_type:complete